MTLPGRDAQSVRAPALARTDTTEIRGLRAGTIVFLGIAAGNLGNYLFHFTSARFLGPASYGDVASLVAVIGLISLPLVGVQVAVARYVAGFEESHARSSIALFFSKALRLTAVIGIVTAAVFCALAFPVREFLGIDSLTAVVLTALVAAPSILSPVVWGLAQGLQRFALFSLSIGLGPMMRPLLAAVFLAVGLGVAGAMGATLLAAIVATAVPLVMLRGWLTRDTARPSPVPGREVTRFLVPTLIGVLSITSLTTVDVIVAKAALSDHDAGLYGSASLIGRVILYLPAAIVLVLLPKVSAREAAGRESRDVLVKSLLVTAGFCGAATVVYAVAPKVLVFLAFGSSFEEASGLLWMFALAMSGYALLNVLLTYHLARGAYRLSFVLLAGALGQLALFAFFHDSPEQLLAIDIGVALALIVAHEVAVMRTLPLFARTS
jgi:O-antigen/teichoic acid export membrane protein